MSEINPPGDLRLIQNKKLYFAALDGWRFWAAVVILIHHTVFLRYFTEKVESYFFLYLASMPFFFMMSGFLAAASTINKQCDFPAVINYYVRRLIRIWPMHFLVLILFLILSFFRHPIHFSATVFTSNLLLIQSWIPDQTYFYSYNAPIWYLSSLMGLYLMTPLFLRYFKTSFCFSIILPAVLTFFIPQKNFVGFFYILPLNNAFKFLSGMIIYRLVAHLLQTHSQKSHSKTMFLGWSVLEIAITVLVILFASQLFSPSSSLNTVMQRYFNKGFCCWCQQNLIVPVLFVFLVIFSMERGVVSWLLSTRTALMLGKLSFVIYVWHYFISIMIKQWDLFHVIPVQWRIFSFIVLTTVLALPLEYCINAPITRLLNSFHKKHPLRLDFLRSFLPLIFAICAVLLYLGCIIPRPVDYTPWVLSTMKRADNQGSPAQIKIYPNNWLFMHPGKNPVSVIFRLNQKINRFSCKISTHHKKADVMVRFYLDDKLVKSAHVSGKNIIQDISFSCSKAGQLRIEVDKNGNYYHDSTSLRSLMFTDKISP